jgi:hypothetical protein
MKLTKAIFSLIISLFIFSACTSDANKAADLFCEISSLKDNLQSAIDKQDEEQIKEIGNEIHELNSELQEILISYENNDKAKAFEEDLISALKNCKSIDETQVTAIQEYIKNPKVKKEKKKRRVRETAEEQVKELKPSDLFCKSKQLEIELKKAEEQKNEDNVKKINALLKDNNRTLEKVLASNENTDNVEEFCKNLIRDLQNCKNMDEKQIQETQEYLENRFLKD